MKKKIYCAYCGTENNSKKEICKNCHKTLSPKDHLWKDYFMNHITDKLKGKVEDKASSIITNFIISHLYGIAFSILFVATAIHGITNITKKDYSYIKEIEESPVEVVELSLEDEQVKKAHALLSLNWEGKFPTSPYEEKKMTYEDLEERMGMTMNYLYLSDYQKSQEHTIIFHSCEDAKDYPDIYNLCRQDDISRTYVIGDGARQYYLFDAQDVEKDYKALYGDDKELPKENFEVYSIYECSYYEKTNEFICHTLETGGLWVDVEVTKLVKAEKVNNQMILYDRYVLSTLNGTFKDPQLKIKISEEFIWENKDLVEQGQFYKHTFKKNGNGEYYWYSSEPVNSLED